MGFWLFLIRVYLVCCFLGLKGNIFRLYNGFVDKIIGRGWM